MSKKDGFRFVKMLSSIPTRIFAPAIKTRMLFIITPDAGVRLGAFVKSFHSAWETTCFLFASINLRLNTEPMPLKDGEKIVFSFRTSKQSQFMLIKKQVA